MKATGKGRGRWIVIGCIFIFTVFLFGAPQARAVNDAFDVKKMGDMSDFDPNNPVIPTGDTIKIAIVASFSGPAALVGQIYYISVQWAAHDINKRGGILVDGKKKLVEVIKAEIAMMSAPNRFACSIKVMGLTSSPRSWT